MRSSRYPRVGALPLMLALAFASTASAQNAGEPAADRELPQQAQERLIEVFLDQATIELNLTEDQRSGLEVVLRETMERRAELARSQSQLRREITDALSDPSTGDDEFQQLADASVALKQQEVELLRWQQRRLLDVLAPRQSLRFMLLQERLAQRIEAVRRNRARQPRNP